MKRSIHVTAMAVTILSSACATSAADDAAVPTTLATLPEHESTSGDQSTSVPDIPSTIEVIGEPSPTSTTASNEGVRADGTNSERSSTTTVTEDTPSDDPAATPAPTAPSKPIDIETAPPPTQPPTTDPASVETSPPATEPPATPPAESTPAPPTPTAPPQTPPPATSPPATPPPETQPPATSPPSTPPSTPPPAPTPAPTAPPPAPVLASSSSEAVRLTNEQRANAGLGALSANGTLGAAAAAHSADQASNGQMTHGGSDGSNVGARISAAGGSFSAWAENVAFGYGSASGVVDGWMNSAGHRDNILNPAYTQIGVASAAAPDGTFYWTMVLAG